MKLIIGNKPVALYQDATLSMERLSPALNEKVGSFSYPFPVPTQPNQQVLGWPGKLERLGQLPSKSFTVEDQGMQLLRGTVEYDTITKEDIGVILKSGITEFYALVEQTGEYLRDVEFGAESWFPTYTSWDNMHAKINSWNANNRNVSSPYTVAPCRAIMGGSPVGCNPHSNAGYLLTPGYPLELPSYYIYALQFRAWSLLEMIFEAFGYNVVENKLTTSVLAPLVVMGSPFAVMVEPVDMEIYPEAPIDSIVVSPPDTLLRYNYLMPEVKTLDFLEEIATLTGIIFDIDDLKKDVRILFKKNIFQDETADYEFQELATWEHTEKKTSTGDGFLFSFTNQDSNLDSRTDYQIGYTVDNYSDLGTVNAGDIITHVTNEDRDYISVQEGASYVWKQIGRLKPYSEGKESVKFEFEVGIPPSRLATLFDGPLLTTGQYTGPYKNWFIYPCTRIEVSLYRGTITNALFIHIPFQFDPMPLVCGDKHLLTEEIYLTPQSIYEMVYREYITWQSTMGRSFTKYLRLSLPQVIALQWTKRYVVSGVRVVFSKINYDLPFSGIVKVEGYVV